MTQCDVTLVLDNWPPLALHLALTRPITDGSDQVLARIDMAAAGGSRVYHGQVYAGSFSDVTMDDLQAFFMAIPAAVWVNVTGIVTVDHVDVPGYVVNRVGKQT